MLREKHLKFVYQIRVFPLASWFWIGFFIVLTSSVISDNL